MLSFLPSLSSSPTMHRTSECRSGGVYEHQYNHCPKYHTPSAQEEKDMPQR